MKFKKRETWFFNILSRWYLFTDKDKFFSVEVCLGYDGYPNTQVFINGKKKEKFSIDSDEIIALGKLLEKKKKKYFSSIEKKKIQKKQRKKKKKQK